MSKLNKLNLRNNLDLITNDVNNLLQKIDSPNEKLFNRKITNDIQLHGYVDPASLYRNNLNAIPSTKIKKDIDLLNQQNIRLDVSAGNIQYKVDNRQQLYPNSDINEYNNLRGAVIKNNDGIPFKNAAIRDTILTYDTLLTEEEKAVLNKRAQAKKTQMNQQYDMQQNGFGNGQGGVRFHFHDAGGQNIDEIFRQFGFGGGTVSSMTCFGCYIQNKTKKPQYPAEKIGWRQRTVFWKTGNFCVANIEKKEKRQKPK
jgi:hypothetical protein